MQIGDFKIQSNMKKVFKKDFRMSIILLIKYRFTR
jgi:hypothetical protein